MVPADSRRIPRAPRYSGYCYHTQNLPVRDFHPLRSDFPDKFQFILCTDVAVLLPRQRRNVDGLGYSAFARHYLRNHNCFLFLPVLRCFSSRRSLSSWMSTRSSTGWVTPFGYVRITGRLHLPAPFRSLPRPSSPPRA